MFDFHETTFEFVFLIHQLNRVEVFFWRIRGFRFLRINVEVRTDLVCYGSVIVCWSGRGGGSRSERSVELVANRLRREDFRDSSIVPRYHRYDQLRVAAVGDEGKETYLSPLKSTKTFSPAKYRSLYRSYTRSTNLSSRPIT